MGLFKKMTIPIPSDEQVLLVPKTQIWTGEWKKAIFVLTNKGIHFRVKKTNLINYSTGGHSLCDNTFLAYDRIESYKQGSGLWSSTYIITMVDKASMRFHFSDMDQVRAILAQQIHLDQPRDMRPYNYSSHHPERGDYKEVSE